MTNSGLTIMLEGLSINSPSVDGSFLLAIAGSILTFLAMFVIKIPFKALTRRIAQHSNRSEYDKLVLNKRLNLIIIFLTFIVGTGMFIIEFKVSGLEHFSFSHAIETGAFAIAYYALFERFFKVSRH